MTYINKSAFCLMHFHCTTCDQIEHVWNSRDGLAPFTISCGCCGNASVHIPIAEPDILCTELPRVATRVLVNATEEKAKQLALIYIKGLMQQVEGRAVMQRQGKQKLINCFVENTVGRGDRPVPVFRREYIYGLKNETSRD